MIRYTAIFRLRHAAGSELESKFLAHSKRVCSVIPGVEKFEARQQISAKNDFTCGFSMKFAGQPE